MKSITIFALLTFTTAATFIACDENPYKQGRVLYEVNCGNCHGLNGEGLGELIPPLVKADYLIQHKTEIPCMIIKGIKGEITVNNKKYGTNVMPPNDKLTDFEITNILNYINASWGNNKEFIILNNVRDNLKNCTN